MVPMLVTVGALTPMLVPLLVLVVSVLVVSELVAVPTKRGRVLQWP